MKKKKIILAFSGGLDTSYCAVYLKDKGFTVTTVTVDTGGFNEKDKKQIEAQSKKVGAEKHYFMNAKQEFFAQIISYILMGNILRGGIYPLCAGAERGLIGAKLVEIAKKEKASVIAHGSTGVGNDQIRFDAVLSILVPKIQIITPIRELGISRDQEIEFLKQKGISISKTSNDYSINRGLLGNTIGGKETKTSWEFLPDGAYPTVLPIDKTSDKPLELIIGFENGLPKKINGKKMSGVEIMEYLNQLGAKYGFGKGVHVGSTILGIKGRVGFEAPAALILIRAHQELEKLVLSKNQLFWKNHLSEVYGNMLHEAFYFDPLMKDLEAFIQSSQKNVTGEVKVKLFKGNLILEGLNSPYSLMNSKVATYGEESQSWNGQDAVSFSKIYSLSQAISYQIEKGEKDEN